ncbi:MAG: PAS domain S-box protein [Synergistota bacterium]|nr:PAS domain S-box protein [Synergistota bacterium]
MGQSSEKRCISCLFDHTSGEALANIFFEETGSANMIVDADTTLLRVNREFERLTGYSREEVEGVKSWTELVYPPDLPLMIENHKLRREHPEKAQKSYDYRFVAAHGSLRWGFLTASILPDGKCTIVSVVDVTELKNKEEALRKSEELYSGIVQTQTELISRFTPDFVLTFVNDAYCRYYDRTRDSLIGKTFTGHALPEDLEKQKTYFASITRENPENEVEERTLPPSGEIRWQHWYDKGIFGPDGELVEIQSTGRDVTERKKVECDLETAYGMLDRAFKKTIEMTGRIIEVRDPYTAGHQRRVALLARRIAEEMDLPKKSRDSAYYAGLVHDVGKIYVPSEILSKPGTLTQSEWMLIRQHPLHSAQILKDLDLPWPVSEIALCHHERLDGSGYPQGIAGDEICLEARILMVADAVEAMASHRPYRPPLGIDAALDEITINRGKLYDPDVVDACLYVFREKGYVFETGDPEGEM